MDCKEIYLALCWKSRSLGSFCSGSILQVSGIRVIDLKIRSVIPAISLNSAGRLFGI